MIRIAVRNSIKVLVAGLFAAGCATTPAPPRTSSVAPVTSSSAQWHVIGSVLTSGESLSHGKRIPTQLFGSQDYIAWLVDLAWDDPKIGVGRHSVEWRWYLNEKLVARGAKAVNFQSTPYTLRTTRAASTLGAGHFKVETVVDGRIIASIEFDITQ